MIPRLLLAAFGAVAITIGLLLLMDDVTSRYILRDPTQYFRITDYIPAPDRGRQLPEVPVVPEIAPDRPEFEHPEEEEQPADEVLPWELPEEAAPNLEEQLILDQRQAALSGGSGRAVSVNRP
ncbi:MAG: hypothetical protein F4181_05295 [Proteobacteria bacterium]|nr:hypothetical protein [Pseudomonadota bacterium]